MNDYAEEIYESEKIHISTKLLPTNKTLWIT